MKKLVGIIGYPIAHSVSPAMHNAAFKHLRMNWSYDAYEVKPSDLADELDQLKAKGLVGFNVTIPHKEAIISLIDDVTKLPKMIGAVNTVRNDEGMLIGFNTDGPGFIGSLREDAGLDPKGKSVVLIGAGGAAKAVAVVLAEAGASRLTITDIDAAKGEQLAEYVGSLFGSEAAFAKPSSGALEDAMADADLIVNATPVGMHPRENESPIEEGMRMKRGAVLFDLVYNPPRTRLMITAEQNGLRTFNGLGMLVRQGALAFTIWTEKEAPIDIMLKAAKEALGLK